jgi:hypothetical protein
MNQSSKRLTNADRRILVHLLRSQTDVGLGDVLKSVLEHVGFHPCSGCARRAEILNRVILVHGTQAPGRSKVGKVNSDTSSELGCRRRLIAPATPTRALPLDAHVRARPARDCWIFAGLCTGFGSRRCVKAPASQNIGAAVVEQCCRGWFQYPWIEVCPGRQATYGCSSCFWPFAVRLLSTTTLAVTAAVPLVPRPCQRGLLVAFSVTPGKGRRSSKERSGLQGQLVSDVEGFALGLAARYAHLVRARSLHSDARFTS